MIKRELRIGDKAFFTKRVNSEDIFTFADISGDDNPVHVDEEYARNSFFKERIAHGFHVGSFISAAIGKKLPGNGTIYLSQTMQFRAPAIIGDEITALVEIVDFPEETRVLLKTTCLNQNGKEVIRGEALVIPPKNMVLLK